MIVFFVIFSYFQNKIIRSVVDKFQIFHHFKFHWIFWIRKEKNCGSESLANTQRPFIIIKKWGSGFWDVNDLRIVVNITVKPIAAYFPVNIIGMVVKDKQSEHLLYDKLLVLSRIISTPKKKEKGQYKRWWKLYMII